MFGLFGKPSKAKFAELVLAKIKEAGGPSDFVFLEKEFEIRRESNRGFLGNAYAAYCHADKAKRENILNNFVAAVTAKPSSKAGNFDEIRSDLVTVVRERALFSFTSLLWQIDGIEQPKAQVHESISEWFAKTVVIDSPSHMTLVNEEQVAEWNTYTPELFAIGQTRLANSKPPRFAEMQGVYKGIWDDDYDSSRILIPGIFDDLPLRGDPVVVLPNRATLLVTGSDEPEAIRRMLEKAEQIVKSEPKAYNFAPLVVRNDVISDYTVPPDSPLFFAVERARRYSALSYYGEQTTNLEELYEKQKKEVFVASYSLFALRSGQHVSRVVWTKGVPTLLPVADEVVFVDTELEKGANVVAQIPWHQVMAILGSSMLDTRMFPTRYYVSEFPTPEVFDRLKGTRER